MQYKNYRSNGIRYSNYFEDVGIRKGNSKLLLSSVLADDDLQQW